MKLLSIFFAAVAFTSIFSSCNKKYTIDGIVEMYGYDGQKLSLVSCTENGCHVVDSCIVQHGSFKMSGKTNDTRFVVLCKGNDPIMPLYIEPGTTHVSLLPTQMIASGTRQNDLLYRFLQKKNAIDNKYGEVFQKKLNIASSGRINNELSLVLEDSLLSIVQEAEDLFYGFITTNFEEEVSIDVFSMMANTSSDSTSISPLMRKILDNAPDVFLESPVVSNYINRVSYSSQLN